MRFRTPFAKGSIFTQMFQPHDWACFNNAYREHKDANKLDKRLAKDREWVRDIILAWSEKLKIPMALAVMVFESGKCDVVQRHYQRLLVKSEQEGTSIRQSKMDDTHKAFAMDVWTKKHKDIELVCKWDSGDLANWCCSHFVEALGISHPKVRFDAHAKREHDDKPKVSKPKGVKTESRTPRAKSKKKPHAEKPGVFVPAT